MKALYIRRIRIPGTNEEVFARILNIKISKEKRIVKTIDIQNVVGTTRKEIKVNLN